VGLIQRGDSDKALHNCARRVRHAFALSGLWKFTLVTRADVRNNTPMALKAQQAMAVMGELPQEVLDGSHRARIAPEVNAAASALSEANDSMEVDNPGDEESS
jgi:hypothetical protein